MQRAERLTSPNRSNHWTLSKSRHDSLIEPPELLAPKCRFRSLKFQDACFSRCFLHPLLTGSDIVQPTLKVHSHRTRCTAPRGVVRCRASCKTVLTNVCGVRGMMRYIAAHCGAFLPGRAMRCGAAQRRTASQCNVPHPVWTNLHSEKCTSEMRIRPMRGNGNDQTKTDGQRGLFELPPRARTWP